MFSINFISKLIDTEFFTKEIWRIQAIENEKLPHNCLQKIAVFQKVEYFAAGRKTIL